MKPGKNKEQHAEMTTHWAIQSAARLKDQTILTQTTKTVSTKRCWVQQQNREVTPGKPQNKGRPVRLPK